MDRVSFFKNINGITYPEMLVDFFDHFLALKNIVGTNNCTVNIISTHNNVIDFIVNFKEESLLQKVMNELNRNGNVVVIYNRTMTVHVEVLTDKDLKIKLY